MFSILNPGKYGRYTVIGAVVGFITIGLREIAGRLLPADNPQFYLVSVGSAYAFGIVLNYLLQRALTFRHASPDARQLASFVIVALIGAAAMACWCWCSGTACRWTYGWETVGAPLWPLLQRLWLHRS